ncbi:hypothetical protein LOTGIDRAFT_235252 [Lottia gigantea]|uniref:EF-hand domain-containing protein n=1 Tax=Lottia gigantea TaxID=225164 RepID=V3Z708_LOTGI|nr:hypothetical protein LOTGIDRAFT_235252 [Lottia gigantea]ESO86623.1 hypothetical protein LOTGIDRAFT_235252 [Lottia gigantea]
MKPKNGRTKNQDYVNLLYSESDSDDPPDLKLPSFNNKPKKSRKKRSSLSLRSSTDQISDFKSSCTGHSILKFFIVIVILLALSVLGFMTFWLLGKVTELRDQIEAVVLITLIACIVASAGLIWMHFELKRDLDNLRDRLVSVEFESKKDNEEFIKIQSDVKSLNKTVQIIKQENLVFKKNLSQLALRFKNITDQSSKLTENLKSIQNLNKLSQIDTLSNTFAALGSDFKTFQKSISPTVDDLKKRVAALENKGGREVDTPVDSKDGESKLVSVRQTFIELHEDIDSLNKTILNTVNNLKTNISNRVKLLENSVTNVLENISSNKTSSGMLASVPTDNMKEQISAVINDMIKKKELTMLSTNNNMTSLQQQVSNLTSIVHEIMSNHSQIISDHSNMFANSQSLDIEDIEHQYQMLNKTVIKLHDDVEVLTSKLVGNTNKLHVVSTTVNALKQYIAHEENISSVLNMNVSSSVNPLSITTTPTSHTETSTQFTPVVIPTVKSYEDLVSKYEMWKSKSPDGHVGENELQNFMHSSTIEALKPYDVNGNGFSLEELVKATGLKKSDVPKDLQNM